MDRNTPIQTSREMYEGTTAWSADWNPRHGLGLSTSNSVPTFGNQLDPGSGFIISDPQYDNPHIQYPKQNPNTIQWDTSQRQLYMPGQLMPPYNVVNTSQAGATTYNSYMLHQTPFVPAPAIRRSYSSRFSPMARATKGARERPHLNPLLPSQNIGSVESIRQQPIPSSQIKSIRVGDEATVLAYYEAAFHALQQTNCRMIAKAFIKVVEPRKQAKYPYNGGKGPDGKKGDPEKTKPAWWPTKVTHREPDHLKKPERVRLLIHLLRGLDKRRGITVDQLEDAGRSIRRRIKPADRLEVLSEIYRVRRVEERYENGHIDGSTEIYVVDRGWKTNNDEETQSPTPNPRSDDVRSSPAPDVHSREIPNPPLIGERRSSYREDVLPRSEDQNSAGAFAQHYSHSLGPHYR